MKYTWPWPNDNASDGRIRIIKKIITERRADQLVVDKNNSKFLAAKWIKKAEELERAAKDYRRQAQHILRECEHCRSQRTT